MSKLTDKERIKELEKSVIFKLGSLKRITKSQKNQHEVIIKIANQLSTVIDIIETQGDTVNIVQKSLDSVQKTMERILNSLQKTRKTLTSATDTKVAERPKREQKPTEFYVA